MQASKCQNVLENALGWSGVTELLAGDREKDRRRRTERRKSYKSTKKQLFQTVTLEGKCVNEKDTTQTKFLLGKIWKRGGGQWTEIVGFVQEFEYFENLPSNGGN